MTASGPNRQAARTRAALVAAFVELLLADGYESVTVEAIARRADVGRSTFYLHFAGREQILKATLAAPSEPLARLVGDDVPASSLIPMLEHFLQQRSRNRVFFRDPIRRLWAECLADLIEPRLRRCSERATESRRYRDRLWRSRSRMRRSRS